MVWFVNIMVFNVKKTSCQFIFTKTRHYQVTHFNDSEYMEKIIFNSKNILKIISTILYTY